LYTPGRILFCQKSKCCNPNFRLNINPESRPDIWQLANVTFKYAKKENPIRNRNNCGSIELSSIPPLPNATQFAEHKANQRKIQQERNNQPKTTTIAPRQRPQGDTKIL